MKDTPVDYNIVKSVLDRSGVSDPGRASIRELVKLVNQIERESSVKFVRMEMGVPGLPAPSIGIEAEIAALRDGVASWYPNIEGIDTLKAETSRFIKLFLNLDISPRGCVPTVGSMMGSLASFIVANRNDRTKEGTLFLDPGFPVHKQQVKMIGHDYHAFDLADYRGSRLKLKLESILKTGKISSILYSNPNNPSWMCLTEEELTVIGELSRKFDVIVIEDLAYFGMDFRKDYSVPGEAPFQPSIGRYTDDYIILISSSKAFSYAGQRIGMMAISDHLFARQYPDLTRYYSSAGFGHSVVYGALYGLSAGVAHSVQHGLAALLKAVNDGTYKFVEDIREYGIRAHKMKELFLGNGFNLVYDTDLDEPLADGFYFTVCYPGMTSSELLTELLFYGISAISLDITGSSRKDGLRACVAQVHSDQFGDLEDRLKRFQADHPVI